MGYPLSWWRNYKKSLAIMWMMKIKGWFRCSNLNCHGYIINLENKRLVEELLNSVESDAPFDTYICENIQTKFLTYMHNPMFTYST